MLELRPTCENCNKPLPPAAEDAMICSFECTFCADCVERVLHNVCPNCGGGFERRPIRPARDWRGGNSLASYPPSTAIRHRPVDPEQHRAFAETIASLAASSR